MNGSSFYHERQLGDLCRMHAVNIVLGRRAFDASTWATTCRSVARRLGDENADAWHDRDFMLDGMTMPLAQMIEHADSNVVTLATTTRTLSSATAASLFDPAFHRTVVLFDHGHVWCCKHDGRVWFNLDSQRTPHPTTSNPSDLLRSAPGVIFVATLAHAQQTWLPLLRKLVSDARLTAPDEEEAWSMWADAHQRIASVLRHNRREIPINSLRLEPGHREALLQSILHEKTPTKHFSAVVEPTTRSPLPRPPAPHAQQAQHPYRRPGPRPRSRIVRYYHRPSHW